MTRTALTPPPRISGTTRASSRATPEQWEGFGSISKKKNNIRWGQGGAKINKKLAEDNSKDTSINKDKGNTSGGKREGSQSPLEKKTVRQNSIPNHNLKVWADKKRSLVCS